MKGKISLRRRKLNILLLGLGVGDNAFSKHLENINSDIHSLKVKPFFKNLEINFQSLEYYINLYVELSLNRADANNIEHELFDFESEWNDENKIAEKIQAKIKEDFISGHTLSVDGWVLSKYEFEIWYLYYLLYKE